MEGHVIMIKSQEHHVDAETSLQTY